MPPKKPASLNVSFSEDSSDSCGPSKGKRSKTLDKDGEDYKKRRERNNIAVKKSREKSREKAKETMQQVNKLRQENTALEQKVTILSKELSVLKDLFLAHAGTVAEGACIVSPPTVTNSDTVQLASDHEYSAYSKANKASVKKEFN